MRLGPQPPSVRLASALAAGAIFALPAGCGDDEAPIEPVTTEAGSSTAPSVDRAEYIASADSRCAEASAAIANLSSGTATSVLAVSQQREITQELLDGLRTLGSPPDPNGDLEAYLAALEDQVGALEQQEQAASSGDAAVAGSLDSALGQAQEEAQSAAEDFGFEECGQEGSAVAGAGGTGTETTPTPTAPVAPTTPPASTVPTTPVAPAPVEPTAPAVPEPTPPAPPTGGTGAGEPGGGGTDGGSSGGSSGGISPG